MQHVKKNRFYKSAMHAAVQYPDLAMLIWEGGSPASDGLGTPLPYSRQVWVPDNTCKKAHCGCRSGCCCLPLSICHGCRHV